MTIYRTIAADPAWPYRDQISMKDGVKRSSASHYPTMTVAEICALGDSMPTRVAGFRIARDAFLWLWVTNPILLDGTGTLVCRSWGFEPRQLITWVKGRITPERFVPHVGLGHFTRGATEHLILATRGRTKDLLQNRRTPNVFIAARSTHSTKPDDAYRVIENLTPGPRLELFARRPREGWTVWGNDPALEQIA